MRVRWWLKLAWWGYLTWAVGRGIYILCTEPLKTDFWIGVGIFLMMILAILAWADAIKSITDEWWTVKKAKWDREIFDGER